MFNYNLLLIIIPIIILIIFYTLFDNNNNEYLDNMNENDKSLLCTYSENTKTSICQPTSIPLTQIKYNKIFTNYPINKYKNKNDFIKIPFKRNHFKFDGIWDENLIQLNDPRFAKLNWNL